MTSREHDAHVHVNIYCLCALNKACISLTKISYMYMYLQEIETVEILERINSYTRDSIRIEQSVKKNLQR